MEAAPSTTYKVVRQFALVKVLWASSVWRWCLIAAQLAWPAELLEFPGSHTGRLRPLHTNAVIFAFGGCALFATSYHVVQRTAKCVCTSDKLAAFTFWGWQAVSSPR